MANNDNPHGFNIFGKLLNVGMYAVATATVLNICPGYIVQSDLTGIDTPRLGIIPQVKDDVVITTVDGATHPFLGVVVECFDEDMNPISYIEATRVGDGTCAGYVSIADHPYQVFEAQIDGTLSAADFDLNHEITTVAINAPDTRNGRSTMEIAVSGSAVTVTVPLRLLYQAYPAEDVGTTVGARYACQINPLCHYRGQGIAV